MLWSSKRHTQFEPFSFSSYSMIKKEDSHKDLPTDRYSRADAFMTTTNLTTFTLVLTLSFSHVLINLLPEPMLQSKADYSFVTLSERSELIFRYCILNVDLLSMDVFNTLRVLSASRKAKWSASFTIVKWKFYWIPMVILYLPIMLMEPMYEDHLLTLTILYVFHHNMIFMVHLMFYNCLCYIL